MKLSRHEGSHLVIPNIYYTAREADLLGVVRTGQWNALFYIHSSLQAL
jgi:hypothetical protein